MPAARALEELAKAYADPAAVAADLAARGITCARTLGTDAPRELMLAAGVVPVAMTAGGAHPTPRAAALMSASTSSQRGLRLFEQLLDPKAATWPTLITRSDALQPQLFAALRELARLGEDGPHTVHLLDLVHIDRPQSAAYNRVRLSRLADWLAAIGGVAPDKMALSAAVASVAEHNDLIRQVARLRPRLSGTQMMHIVGSAAILPPERHKALLREILEDGDSLIAGEGARIFVTGTAPENDAVYAMIEASGAVIVGEDHAWGPTAFTATAAEIASPLLRAPSAALTPSTERAQTLAAMVAASGATMVLHLSIGGDEAAPWDVAALRRALPDASILALRTSIDGDDKTRDAIAGFLAGRNDPATTPAKPASAIVPAAKRPPAGAKSRKSLASVADFGTYQREWFADVRRRVAEGAPFAMVNANAPQEILRALDIPFVVNQWWASIVAAKQQSRRYLGLLRALDFPADVESYSSQGIAAFYDDDAEQAPWGGLPTPDFVHAIASSDPTAKIFAEWARVSGADCYIYERTVDPRWEIETDWWDALPERWDSALEAERIDLLVAEIREVIARLETATGRSFSTERFAEVMTLVNEQEDYYRRTRDLIAVTVPAPIGIVDSMPATMVPQWHRGTIWARDAAKAFYEEVATRVRDGAAAVPNERVRLMWVGRGMWSEMGFYQQWEESHGAVFVWSMYLALAADGYIRRTDGGRDVMRSLAARFLTMGDELRMPSWAGPWHVHEAQTHQVDGAVALADADPFVLRALQKAGVAVLELGVDNFNREGDDAGQIEARVTAFIEGPARDRARKRLDGAR